MLATMILMVMAMLVIMALPDKETVSPQAVVWCRVWADRRGNAYCCLSGPRDSRIRDCVLPAV